MPYPLDMTADEIMDFEYEYNRYLDIQEAVGQPWVVNAELQVLSCSQDEAEVLTYAQQAEGLVRHSSACA